MFLAHTADHITQSEDASVDVFSLFLGVALCFGPRDPLAARQVDHVNAAIGLREVLVHHLHAHPEDCMRTR